MTTVLFTKVREGALYPGYATKESACMDLAACIEVTGERDLGEWEQDQWINTPISSTPEGTTWSSEKVKRVPKLVKVTNVKAYSADPTTPFTGIESCTFLPQYLAEGRFDDSPAVVVQPGMRVMVPTGLKASIQSQRDGYRYSLRIQSRSGLAIKSGLVCILEGIVDADYDQEIFVLMQNVSSTPKVIVHRDRIAQIELCKREVIDVDCDPGVFTLEATPRLDALVRSGGFGSTGVSNAQ